MIGFSNSGEHHRARPLDAKATLSLARDDIINGRALLAPPSQATIRTSSLLSHRRTSRAVKHKGTSKNSQLEPRYASVIGDGMIRGAWMCVSFAHFAWYGSLCPANRIRAGRVRRTMRDTRRMVGL